jgi:DNA-binding response OmpR family regulator
MARVTVINNSDEFLGMMADLLEATGHDCMPLRGAEYTIDAIADTAPDAMIVDLRLTPSVLTDGWAVVVGARSHPRLRSVPIILATGDHQFLKERAQEIAAMADVHPLPKPFSITDVEEMLDRLLSRDTRPAATA